MAKITTAKQTVEIPHPQMPELIATCIVLEPIEAMDLFGSFQEYQKVKAITDDEGNLVYDKDGNLESRVLTHLPAKAVLDIMLRLVENVVGLEDEKGPMKFEKTHTFLKSLFHPALRVKHDDGTRQPYADYIQSELNRMATEANEDEVKAPKAKASTKPR